MMWNAKNIAKKKGESLVIFDSSTVGGDFPRSEIVFFSERFSDREKQIGESTFVSGTSPEGGSFNKL